MVSKYFMGGQPVGWPVGWLGGLLERMEIRITSALLEVKAEFGNIMMKFSEKFFLFDLQFRIMLTVLLRAMPAYCVTKDLNNHFHQTICKTL